MRKSTRAISLALVGSGLILSGCLGHPPDSAEDTGRSRHAPGYGGPYHGGPRPYGGRTVVPGPSGGGHEGAAGHGGVTSPRGGFGAAGHAAGGS